MKGTEQMTEAPPLHSERSERGHDLEARAILQHELDYRRQRRSAIFTWVNTILIAITGGVVALQMQTGQSMSRSQQVVISAAVVVLSVYSGIWWDKQRRLGANLRKQLNDLDGRLMIPVSERAGGVSDRVGGLYTIALLAVAAVIAIWLPVN